MALKIESIHAEPGQKTSGYVHVDVGIADIRVPIVLINGSTPGPRLTLTAGIHHGEFVGIEALRSVLHTIDATQLAGEILACPLANPPSFYGCRGNKSPLDEINPNRIFPGNPLGSPTERLADWLFTNLMAGADAYIDLHGGSLTEGMVPLVAYRTTGDDALDARTYSLTQAFGFADVIRGTSSEGGNTHAAAARAGIPSLLIEIGSKGSRAPEDIAQLVDGIFRSMDHLGMYSVDNLEPAPAVRQWRWEGFVEAGVEGLWYPEFEIGEEVVAGDRLGRILDPLGNELSVVTAPVSGRVFYGERGLVAFIGSDLAAIAVLDD